MSSTSDNQAPDFVELEARLQAVASQRNVALNDAAILAGQLALAQREIGQLKEQLQALTTQLAERDAATPT